MLAHIVRLDGGATHGWQVRFNLSDDTSRYESKLFSDRLCGGKRKARRQADEFLQTELRKHGIDDLPRGRRRGMMFAEDPDRTCRANTSGRTGVYRGEHTRQLANGVQQVRYYAASYTIGPDGRRTKRSKKFYFGTERTEDEALDLAIEFREGWEDAYLSGGATAVKRFFKSWNAG